MDKTENIIQRDIVQNAKLTHADIVDEVVDEVSTLLGSTMSSKDMTKLEIRNIANRLIKFQTKQDAKGEEV